MRKLEYGLILEVGGWSNFETNRVLFSIPQFHSNIFVNELFISVIFWRVGGWSKNLQNAIFLSKGGLKSKNGREETPSKILF